jgi:hypothetical protein
MIPTGVLGDQILARAWVPMDDTHTMFFSMTKRALGVQRATQRGLELLPNTTDWYGRFRMESNAGNDYRIDRAAQRSKAEYTGIPGVHTQDQAVTESMGAIYDRSQEHLGASDAMVIRVRRRLLETARALAEHGRVPYSAEHPEVYRQRSGGILLPEGADWVAATQDLRQAYATHDGVNVALGGR